MESKSEMYKQAWTREETLDQLNKRIHDGASSPQDLLARAQRYRDRLITDTYPMAVPPESARVMELGSGVGWIMQAMIERFPIAEITGLDISEVMIRRGKERLPDERVKWQLYDGFTFPFEDNYFDNIYSAAAIQHINKDVVFLLFKEMHRCIKPGGHVTFHVLSIQHVVETKRDFTDVCKRHIAGSGQHHLYFYTAEELLVWCSDLIGATDFDVRALGTSLYVHFSKGGAEKFLRPEIAEKIPFRRRKK